MKKWIIIGAVLVLVGGLAGTGYLLLSRLGGPGAGEETGAPQAAMDVEGAPVEVVMGEISSVLVLDAVVRAEPGETVEAGQGGTVSHLWVADGAEVDNGAPIVNVRVPDTSATGTEGEGGNTAATREITLYAPASGTVTGLDDVRVGDVLEPGAVAATVAPDEFRAVASIPPNDLYRFYEEPEDILLRIDQGPPATQCEFLSLGASEGGGAPVPEGGEVPGAGGGGGGGGGGTELACRVPADLEVFDGVRGQLSVSTGKAENVLVIPVTAVRGTSEAGEVLVVGDDGTEEVREVELGVSDGEFVEVTSGLSVGDVVMDPIPLDPRFDVPGANGSEETRPGGATTLEEG
ncbi:efflux RND transporter periplasmic adaptor subunit [Nocardiopsis halotolerans]|uniref:efflux RND transporter periplasmic adaptor subunit n=1 Tax=Nocardiopsis halotolerans TaxID=124252 RepID=UPI00034ADDC3|nr:efflux RND transporter periplasmic adaptor subunit [Nocardiopsis halotolerans]